MSAGKQVWSTSTHYAVTVTNMLFESKAKAEEYAKYLGELVIEVSSRLAWASAIPEDGVGQVLLPVLLPVEPLSQSAPIAIRDYIKRLQMNFRLTGEKHSTVKYRVDATNLFREQQA